MRDAELNARITQIETTRENRDFYNAEVLPDVRWLIAALRSAREDSARLRASLTWVIAEYEDGLAGAPDHDCGYIERPDTGYCEFHDRWADAKALVDSGDEDWGDEGADD